MIDFIIVSMLLYLKDDLMSREPGSYTLQRLLTFPPVDFMDDIKRKPESTAD